MQDRRPMCVGLSRLKNEMVVVLHKSLIKGTTSTWATQFWQHMYRTWTRLGVVIDVGNISGANMSLAVDKVIEFSKANRKYPPDVKRAVSPSSVFSIRISYRWLGN